MSIIILYLRFKTGFGKEGLSKTFRTTVLPILLLRSRDADLNICICFVTDIVAIPKAEADAVIHYIDELTTTTQEIHIRFQWRKNDVVLLDNRICVSVARLSTCAQRLIPNKNHTASYDFAPNRRHAVRVAAQAEPPSFDPSNNT